MSGIGCQIEPELMSSAKVKQEAGGEREKGNKKGGGGGWDPAGRLAMSTTRDYF